ncbi:HD domain-containing protein [Kitasatospora paracochleata]|uniref:HD superfamily phosphodiesterase n=1 Tax=Kitasatospora paracochleata TaxID=58354 RepID=A0ABT1IV84_9ACTN|nr:HD domain-containing protein [Kitasatospora paracochleata]MCP2308791.1 HD superfamily phosphodiesterase [Kitasatospora paracochleata]
MTDRQQRIRPLPERAHELLAAVDAPPRLRAHLELVHDVAAQLLDGLAARWPQLAVDGEAVRFGAATHDIGKVRHPEELTGPGHAHEPAGADLLGELGVPPHDARFARTHASWHLPGISTEELLVSLADKIWKNRRQTDLEDLVVARLAAASGEPSWEVFLALDDLLGRLGEDADRRLAHQAAFPVVG